MRRRSLFKILAGGVYGAATGTLKFPPVAAPIVDERLPKILIPMIRRCFPILTSSEIIAVQPMSGPVGTVFALRYEHDTIGNFHRARNRYNEKNKRK